MATDKFEEIEKTVKETVCSVLLPRNAKRYLTWEEINLSFSFLEDLEADSLDMVELVMELEEIYDIEMPLDADIEIATVEDAVNLIKEVLGSYAS